MSWSAAARESGSRQNFCDSADNFEKLATDLIRQCYSTHQQRTHILLAREVHILGNVTCIQLAQEAKALKFLSSTPSQSLLEEFWADKNYIESLLQHIPV